MLPRSGAGLPPWRRQVMPWTMAATRLLVAWFVLKSPVAALMADPGFAVDAVGKPIAWGVATLLGVGTLLFAWPRTVLVGYVLVVVGVLAFEWIWRSIGMRTGASVYAGLAAFTVLAAGEWLVQRLQKRLYGPSGS